MKKGEKLKDELLAKDKPTKPNGETIAISPPKIVQVVFGIEFFQPYVQHRFGAKARIAMIKVQEAGSTGKSKSGPRKPKDFDALYRDACHVRTPFGPPSRPPLGSRSPLT